MTDVLHQEWENQNANRAYPFQEDMTRIPHDENGNLIEDAQLPNYVIVDMVCTLPGSADVRLYLSQLAVVGNLLTLTFSESTGDTLVGTLTIDRSTHVANTGYMFVGVGAWIDARGRAVFGDLSKLDSDLAEGLYWYDSTQTLFEACTVRPSLRGVRTLQLQNLDNLSSTISGHVKLVAGTNVSLEYDSTNNAITINAVPNAGYQEACECETGSAQTNVVRTINGIPIEDVTLVGDDSCVQVTTTGNTIRISDKCSEPCCGCPELEFLTDSLKVIDATLLRLEEYSQRLDERITNFVTQFVLTLS